MDFDIQIFTWNELYHLNMKSLFAKGDNAISENLKIRPTSFNKKLCLLYLAHYL